MSPVSPVSPRLPLSRDTSPCAPDTHLLGMLWCSRLMKSIDSKAEAAFRQSHLCSMRRSVQDLSSCSAHSSSVLTSPRHSSALLPHSAMRRRRAHEPQSLQGEPRKLCEGRRRSLPARWLPAAFTGPIIATILRRCHWHTRGHAQHCRPRQCAIYDHPRSPLPFSVADIFLCRCRSHARSRHGWTI